MTSTETILDIPRTDLLFVDANHRILVEYLGVAASAIEDLSLIEFLTPSQLEKESEMALKLKVVLDLRIRALFDQSNQSQDQQAARFTEKYAIGSKFELKERMSVLLTDSKEKGFLLPGIYTIVGHKISKYSQSIDFFLKLRPSDDEDKTVLLPITKKELRVTEA